MRITIEEKRFGDKLIFSAVVFDIRKGMRTALLGPSGRGKTTLLRIAAGLDDDFIGRVDDRPEMPGILFQEDRLSERVSVLSNLMAVTDDRQKALEALGKVGLEGEGGHYIPELSGGMRRRVAIARLLLLPSDSVFLDEPFQGLDGESKKIAASALLEYSQGKTMLFITHDEEDVSLLGAESVIRL